MTDIEYFAANFKYLRQKKNFKQEDMAELFNVTGQAVSKWETEKSLPDIKTLMKIAEYFNVSMEDLLSKDLSIESEKKVEEKVVIIQEPAVSSLMPRYRIKDGKESKTFFYTNLIFAILIAASWATLFCPADIFSLIIVLALTIANIFVFVNCIRAMIKVKRHTLIKEELYVKSLKIVASLNLAAVIWFVSFTIFVEDLSMTEIPLGSLIFFAVIYALISVGAMLSNVFYNKLEKMCNYY